MSTTPQYSEAVILVDNVDMLSRTVLGQDRTGAMFQASFRSNMERDRIPRTGENWVISRQAWNEWRVEYRVPTDLEVQDIAELEPGDRRITADGVLYLEGTDLQFNGGAIPSAPAGPAGGVLSGTYPNPDFATNAASLMSYAGGTGMSATNVEAAIDELADEKANITNTVMDGDAAGGVLSGTYPNPGFAVDMATQAELDAHINDTTDAHDASAISIVDAGTNYTGTDVEAALAEIPAMITTAGDSRYLKLAADNDPVTGQILINSGATTNTPGSDLFTAGLVLSGANAALGISRATGNTALAVWATGNTHRKFWFSVDGQLNWGTGTGTTDVNLYRSGADTLSTDDSFAALALYGRLGDATGEVAIARTNTSGIEFGSARDTNLYRRSANVLATNDEFDVVGSFFRSERGSTGDPAYAAWLTGDSVSRYVVAADGTIGWGPGGAAARDVNLYRAAADILATDDTLRIGQILRANTTSLIFQDNSSVQMARLVMSTGWSDSATSNAFLQLGTAAELRGFITGPTGAVLSRLGVSSTGTTFSASAFGSIPPPTSLISLHGTGSSNGILFGEGASDSVTINRSGANQLDINASGSGGTIRLNSKAAFVFSDTWLRINEAAAFTSGTYFGSGIVRTDGTFQVGSAGANVLLGSTGLTLGGDANISRSAANTFLVAAGDKIQQTEAPTVGDDLVNKTYADTKVSKSGDTMTGDLIISNTGDVTLTLQADTDNIDETHNPLLYMTQDGGSIVGGIGINDSNRVYVLTDSAGVYRQTTGGTQHLMWDAGNDGAASGLDADLLDGQQGSYYESLVSGLKERTGNLESLWDDYGHDHELTYCFCIHDAGSAFANTPTTVVMPLTLSNRLGEGWVVGASSITIPKDGWYRISASVGMSTPGVNAILLANIRINSTTIQGGGNITTCPSFYGFPITQVNPTRPLYLKKDDVIDLICEQNSGAARTFLADGRYSYLIVESVMYPNNIQNPLITAL